MIYFSLNQPIFYVLFRCIRFVSVLKCLFSAFWIVKRNQGKTLEMCICYSVINRNSNDISQFYLCRTIDLFRINFYFTIYIKMFSIHIHLIYYNINEPFMPLKLINFKSYVIFKYIRVIPLNPNKIAVFYLCQSFTVELFHCCNL